MYARLIHTVDHVEGRLRPDLDALDAFLAHAWAVTVTGAPKAWAMQFIEDHERSRAPGTAAPSACSASTATSTPASPCAPSTSRTGWRRCASGATLLYDSEPEAEEAETQLKASAFLDVIRRRSGANSHRPRR
jgi:anthranilate synthase